jgi:flagellar hook-associated protein 1 FlgK
MPTIGSILATATSALRTQQSALDVVSHNIANAATEGYSRQRPVLASNTALRTPDGVFGTGVGIATVQQVRDALIDASFRTEVSNASEQETRAQTLGRVETMLGEPSEQGLAATFDRFLSAWSDLAVTPGSVTNRSVVRQRAIELTDKLHDFNASLDQIRQEVDARLGVAVGRINALVDEVTRLNTAIVSVEAAGVTAGDLRDVQNRALDELATLIPIDVTRRENGSVGVATSGYNIIDGAAGLTLKLGSVAGTMGIAIEGHAGLLPDAGGATGALLEVLNTDIPAVRQSLDDFAAALVGAVNTVHGTGTGPDGGAPVDFFDPAGTSAGTIELSADVLASARRVAAGAPDGGGSYQAGANDVALSIAALRDTILAGLGTTPGEHLQGLVSSIGLAVRSSTDKGEVHRTLADQADGRRMSLSGVSVDEELVQMIQFQSAYQAAARVVTAVDEMLQSLLAI